MKRIFFGLVVVGAGFMAMQQVTAQKSKIVKQPAKPAPAKKLPQVDVLLGRSSMSSGTLPKRIFDSLVKQHIQVASGGKILGFTFTYAEHMLYEDSIGNPLRLVDYLVEYCPGDSLTSGINSSLFDRTKAGDTAYFSKIKVVLPSGQEAAGKTMTFLIGR